MKRALGLALAAAILLPAGVVGQGERSEIEAPWDESDTMTVIETGHPEVAGIPDDDFCRAMGWLLQVEPTDADVAMCARLIGESMNEQAWIAESWLPLISQGADNPPGLWTAEPVRAKGKGNRNSEPFWLQAGDYKVTLKTGRRCDEYPSATLERADGGGVSGGRVEQDGYIYGVDEGRYYWDGTADRKCQWAYTLTRLDQRPRP